MHKLTIQIDFDLDTQVWENEHKMLMFMNLNDVYITSSTAIRHETMLVVVERRAPWDDNGITNAMAVISAAMTERFYNIRNLQLKPLPMVPE